MQVGRHIFLRGLAAGSSIHYILVLVPGTLRSSPAWDEVQRARFAQVDGGLFKRELCTCMFCWGRVARNPMLDNDVIPPPPPPTGHGRPRKKGQTCLGTGQTHRQSHWLAQKPIRVDEGLGRTIPLAINGRPPC